MRPWAVLAGSFSTEEAYVQWEFTEFAEFAHGAHGAHGTIIGRSSGQNKAIFTSHMGGNGLYRLYISGDVWGMVKMIFCFYPPGEYIGDGSSYLLLP